MAAPPYRGPERRGTKRPSAAERSDLTLRLLLTTERLERLTRRLEETYAEPKEEPDD